MAANATDVHRFPRAVTFTLHLATEKGEKYSKKGEKKHEKGEQQAKNGKAAEAQKPAVSLMLPERQIKWKNIIKGDVVQFVPNRHDKRLKGASVLVRFVGRDKKTPASPFEVNMIRSMSFHKVVHSRKLFCAICAIVMPNGDRYGYETDGIWLCDKPRCP